MRVIHILKDGTVTDSIKGTVIRDKKFYDVLQRIIERKNKK